MRPTLQFIAAGHVLAFIGSLAMWFYARRRYDGTGVWLKWKQHDNPWCELDRSWNFAREPSNSLADFPYLAFALFLSYCTIQDSLYNTETGRNDVVANPLVSLSAAFVNLFHFVGTWMNHSCRCFVGHVLDCSGMYSVIAWFGLYGCWQLHKSRNPNNAFAASHFFVAVLIVYFALVAFEQRFPGHRVRDLVSLAVALFTAYHAVSYTATTKGDWHPWLVKLALGLCAIAGIAWILDTSHLVCKPESWLQGHALFHYLTAVALLLAYLFVRSQRYATIAQTFAEPPLLRDSDSDTMLGAR